MKKTLKFVFLSVIIVLLSAMAIHIAAAYVSIGNDRYASAPASVAFLLIVPYAIAVAICCAAWTIADRVVTRKNKNKANTDKCN